MSWNTPPHAAWKAFGLNSPPRCGGWVNADFEGGWTCCVDQGHYGHRAQKATWLYAFGVPLPILKWDKSSAKIRLDDGFHSKEEAQTRHADGSLPAALSPPAARNSDRIS